MAHKIGKQTIRLDGEICICSSAGIAGHKESEGPLGQYFDEVYADDLLEETTWEKAESRLQSNVARIAAEKAGLHYEDIDVVLAGDLLNQCISSTFGLRSIGVPFLGQYGACSTMAQPMLLCSLLTDSGAVHRAMAVTSSHFCSAERQFRLPIEYGGQRPLTAQWTVTGAGAVIIEQGISDCMIKDVTLGKINDLKIKDANNMGAAMAPAAADTIITYLNDTHTKPEDYDLILTGDLGYIGSELLIRLLQMEDIDISKQHNDCGKLIFDREVQDVHAGGSGCGCCASVFCSYIMQQIKSRKLKNILFAATGALMSPTSSQQGESIPGISHLVHICSNTQQ